MEEVIKESIGAIEMSNLNIENVDRKNLTDDFALESKIVIL